MENDEVFFAFIRRLEAKRALIYRRALTGDVHTALARVQEHAAELIGLAARSVPRLLASRTIARDRREELSTALTTLGASMRALQAALDAYAEARR